ncbi:MAG: hypothetical protein AB7P20_15905 [Rhizobiaceae bacterium]
MIELRPVNVPPCDPGAPLPIVLADETRFVFGYRTAHIDESRNAIFTVEHSALKFGHPNDEALSGHRYYCHGLTAYGAYEVFGSEWIEDLRQINRVSFPNMTFVFSDSRHFIFTFHDSTLEFIVSEPPISIVTDGDLLTDLLTAFRS